MAMTEMRKGGTRWRKKYLPALVCA